MIGAEPVTHRHSSEVAQEAAGAADGALGIHPLVGLRASDFGLAFQQLAAQALTRPQLALTSTAGLLAELGRGLVGASTLAPDPKDKRFSDPAWKSSPLNRALLLNYLAWQSSLHSLVDDADLSRADAERARFMLGLLTDALAPTNLLVTNPAALKRVIDSGGTSLARGLINMLDDIAHNGGMPSQVDRAAFQIGKNLALTPGSVVFSNELLELIQYAPATAHVYARPLLIVPPQINKFYVLDLAPGRSMIEYLVSQGFTTFVVSWRNPTSAQRNFGLAAYVWALLEASEAVRAISASEELNVVGACSGGITLSALLGHLAALGDKRVHAATLLVTVLDTRAESQLGYLATPEMLAAARAASQVRGVLDGSHLARVFSWLRPNDLVWNYWVNNYLLGEAPPAFDVLYWNADTTNLPARLHGDMLDLYESNPFRHPGALAPLGTPIDLTQLCCDTYLVAGVTDHITPWQACYATTQLVGGSSTFVLSNSGHIQSLVNPPGNPKASFFTNPVHPDDPKQWLAGAQRHTGSWWEHWRDWLAAHSGEQRPAPAVLGGANYPAGAAAPGTYVFQH